MMHNKIFLLAAVLVLGFHYSVWAGNIDSAEPVNWFFLIIGLLGGLALFLYGMEKMSDGLKRSAGDKMRNILAVLSNNRFVGLLVGAFVTMVIQSSSATTVMLVSFVQSGLMSFAQSLGIILGANIGTTITAQLVAFKLTDYSVLMIAIGFATHAFSKKDNWQSVGDTILGFGLLFMGMEMMSESMKPLRSYEGFVNLLKGLENPILGILAGAIFTALIQSSSAFTGIVIVLAMQNLVTLQAGIPMVIGANIGTSVTAALASMGANTEAKRVALAHTFFNVGGALLFVFWLPYFAKLISTMGVIWNFDVARNIANAHTVFNFVSALFFLPLTPLVARLIQWILKDKQKQAELPAAKLLDKNVIGTPTMAIDLARKEIAHMTIIVQRMFNASLKPFIQEVSQQKDQHHPEWTLMEGLHKREAKMDKLESEIAAYLIEIGKTPIKSGQINEVFGLISVVNNLESIGDIIHREIINVLAKKKTTQFKFSEQGQKELQKYHKKIGKQMQRLQEVLDERNSVKAVKILVKGEKYKDDEQNFIRRHFERIRKDNPESVETHELHMDLISAYSQIEVYLENIAKTIATTSPTK